MEVYLDSASRRAAWQATAVDKRALAEGYSRDPLVRGGVQWRGMCYADWWAGEGRGTERIKGTYPIPPPGPDLPAVLAEVAATAVPPATPLLLLLAPGTDPAAAVAAQAEAAVGGRLAVVSLGQGQGPRAAAAIEAARRVGGWVLLANCHLAPSWLPTLERLQAAIWADNTNPRFRLLLTSVPTPAFPTALLAACVKLSWQPPAGMRAALRRGLNLEPLADPAFWAPQPQVQPHEGGAGGSGAAAGGSPLASAASSSRRRGESLRPGSAASPSQQQRRRTTLLQRGTAAGRSPGAPDPRLSRLLFGLVFLHAAVQERRRYGPIGWNVPYGFDDGDLRISATQLRNAYADACARGTPLPYEALRYAIGECNYGGSLLSYVESLPASVGPEVLGLHANADLTKDLATSNSLLASLAATSGTRHGGVMGGGGGGGASAAAAGAVVVRELLSSLPHDFDLEAASVAAPPLYSQSLNGVLLGELARYNGLLGRMRGSLEQLGAAAAGRQLLGPQLERLAADLEAGRLPEEWKPHSYPSLKPLGSYVADLLQRTSFMHTWLEGGLPASFWLGAFFFPPALLTAVLQNFTRHHKVPIDTVGFDFEVIRQQDAAYRLASPAPSGIYVTGLQLEGAGWDEALGCLVEAAPGQLVAPLPPVWFKPQRLAEGRSRPSASVASLPVYRTAARRGDHTTTGHSSNLLLSLRLPMTAPRGLRPSRSAAADELGAFAEHWVLRGAAVLVSLAD